MIDPHKFLYIISIVFFKFLKTVFISRIRLPLFLILCSLFFAYEIKIRWRMFLSVDSIAFVHLRISHAQLSLPFFVPFFDQTPENANTNDALEVVCTLTLKSVLG